MLGYSGGELWITTLVYSIGSSALAIVLGVSSAWLVARTDAPFGQTATVAAFLSLAVPVIVKSIGWIMLLGPNGGLINVMLRGIVGGEEGPIQLYSLGGMIFVEGLLWTPVVFLLTLPVLGAMDPSLEEAAATSGADLHQTLRRITLAADAAERPGGVPAGAHPFAGILRSAAVDRLSRQSAHADDGDLRQHPQRLRAEIRRSQRVRGVAAGAGGGSLGLYYRVTKEVDRYATITGKGFRPRRLKLGIWRRPLGLWLLIIPLALAAPVLIMLWASFLPVYKPPELADFATFSLANYRSVWGHTDTLSGFPTAR